MRHQVARVPSGSRTGEFKTYGQATRSLFRAVVKNRERLLPASEHRVALRWKW